MGTEADKTNTAVIGTLFAIGTAAMIAGSAALVALARGEMTDTSEQLGGYADLNTVRDLKAQQRARLQDAKLPVTKAQALVLAEIQKDPSSASPPLPVEQAAPEVAGDAGAPPATSDGATEGEALPTPEGAAPAPTAAGEEGAAPPAPAPPQEVPKAPPAPKVTPPTGANPAPTPSAPAPTSATPAPKPTSPKAATPQPPAPPSPAPTAN